MNNTKKEQGVLISVNPPYTRMISSGFKKVEFRNSIIKSAKEGNKLFVYETKNKGGLGKVIGECEIGVVYCEDEIGQALYKTSRYQAHGSVSTSNDSLFSLLFKTWWEMLRDSSLPFEEYVKDVGLSGNFAITIKDFVKYEVPLPLTIFESQKGFVVEHPPQNMMNVVKVEEEFY